MIVYAVFITIAFLISIAVILLTSNTCQRIFTKNATDFQEVQTSATNIQLDIFSEVETTGTEVTKKGGSRSNFQEKHHPPTLLFGLHLIELITLVLLSIHCLAHCHSFGTYLKSTYLKSRQRAIEKQAKREAEENEKIEMQVQKRMKEKREAANLNPNTQLENMKTGQDRDQRRTTKGQGP